MPRALIAARLAAAWILLGAALPVSLHAAPNPTPVEGRILDAVTGTPVADAVVVAGSRLISTDREGRFRLTAPHDTTTIVVRRIGYRQLTVRAAEISGDLRLTRAPVLLRSMDVAADASPSRCLCEGTQLAYGTAARTAIAERAAISLAEAIEGAEGTSSSRPGNWGAKTYVRGLGGERVVVMLDGNRLERACNIGMDGGLATINPDNVERVEILSGPGSTLYGSGNVGGVINVVTRGPEDDTSVRGELRASGSSAVPGGRLGGTIWARRDRASFTASLDGASYGDQRSPLGTVQGSSYRDLTADVAGAYAVAPSHRLGARVQRYSGRDIGYPGAGPAFIPEQDRSLYALDYGWQHSGRIVDGVNAKLFLQSVDHHMTVAMTRPPSTPGGTPMRSETDAKSDTDTWGGRAQARLRAGRAATLDAGFEATQWSAEGSRWIERTMMGATSTMILHTWPGVRVTDLGGFLQGSAAVSPWLDASAGARLDRVLRRADGFDRTSEWVPSGNVGLRAHHAGGLYARASLGYGYRIPDPTELFGILLRPDGFVYVGDPDLVTETSRNVEVSAGYAAPRLQASSTLFRNRIDGYIATAGSGDSVSGLPVRRYANIATARLQGVSGAIAVGATDWLRARCTASYTQGEDLRSGASLPLVTPFEASAAARLMPRAAGAWIEPEAASAARQTRPAEGEVETPGWVVWNLRAGTTVERTTLTVGVENLFDADYRRHLDPKRLHRPGRNFFGRITQRI